VSASPLDASGGSSSPFRFCPRCGGGGGAGGPSFLEGKRWLCPECGFEYFHNVATAVGVFVESGGKLLFLERAREPRAGKLGLPGGFVDPGEGAEEAARRECLEEIGWAPPALAFLASFPNSYDYKGVRYNTCDFYFRYRFPEGGELPKFALCDGEAAAMRMIAPSELRDGDLAFPSLVRAVAAYRDRARLG
jgi:NAD+ diphosphatase